MDSGRPGLGKRAWLRSGRTSSCSWGEREPERISVTGQQDWHPKELIRTHYTDQVSSALISFLKPALASACFEWPIVKDRSMWELSSSIDEICWAPLRRHYYSLTNLLIGKVSGPQNRATPDAIARRWMLASVHVQLRWDEHGVQDESSDPWILHPSRVAI